MADISAFPTIRHVLESGENLITMTAGAAITAGQVVSFHGTGVSRTVHPCIAGTTGQPVGVALYTVSSGAEVAVATTGCICTVANADDTTGIDAGDTLQDNDNAVGGTVNALALSGGVTPTYCVGYALDDIAGGGTGEALIMPSIITPAA